MIGGRPGRAGDVLDGVDWSRWSVILLKPDCLRRDLVEQVLDRLAFGARIVERRRVVVEDWQIFVHYWDMLVDRHWFDRDVPACLREAYVGRDVVVALAAGPAGVDTPARLRRMLGSFDPAAAEAGTIRGDLGADDLETATAQRRLVENLVHTSDDARAVCRDFGIWFGANERRLLAPFALADECADTAPSTPSHRRPGGLP